MEKRTIFIGGGLVLVILLAVIILVVSVNKSEDHPAPPEDPNNAFAKAYYTSCDPPGRDSPQGVYESAAVSSDAVPCAAIAKNILKKNGTAADAAIAGMFCVGVVNAQSCGIGGGFFATIYSKKENQVFTLDAREVAPLAAYPQMYDPKFNENLQNKKGNWWEKKSTANLKGPLSVAVPGEVSGLYTLYERFGGGLPWAQLLEPAIKLCEEGYNLTWYTGGIMYPMRQDFLQEESMSIFTNSSEKRVLRDGELMRRPQLAKTLRILQEDPTSLYKGQLATNLVEDLKSIGGIITEEDLFNYKPIWRDPVEVHLKTGNFTVYSMPPPGGGLIVGLILNILDEFDLSSSSLGPQEKFVTHQRMAEAMKFTFAQRYNMGDLDDETAKQLIANLTSDEFAASIRAKISDVRTSDDPLFYGTKIVPVEDEGTAHFSLVAPNGDAVSITSSINFAFGAGIRSPSTGIIYNNQMADFTTSSKASKPGDMQMDNNSIIPGKRPLSSMSPSIVLDSNRNVHLVFGAGGGIRIPSASAWVAARNLFLGQSVKEAVDSCRSHHSLIPMKLDYETGFPTPILEQLEHRGHKISPYKWKTVVTAIGRNSAGSLLSNYDYRKSGQIAGF